MDAGTEGQDQVGNKGKDDSTNALRREGRVDRWKSHEPKEQSADSLRAGRCNFEE